MSEDNNDPKPKNKGGRPPKLTPFKIQKTKELIEEGKNNKEIAEILNVTTTTLNNWKSMSEQFLTTYNEAKHNLNEAVRSSLFSKATGYTIEKRKVIIDDTGKKRTEIEEVYYPPDTQAQQFWLKNKDPENFKDKTEQHITGNVASVMTESPEAQLERLKSMLKDTNETPDSTK